MSHPCSACHLPLDPLCYAYANLLETSIALKRAFRYLRQHGNGKRGQQEREEARGLRVKSLGRERQQVALCKRLKTATVFNMKKSYQKKCAQPLHNPCTSLFSSFTSLSCGTRTTLCTSIYFGEMSSPDTHSCTTHPPNPLHKPARVQYGLSCLELLRIALLLLCFLV